MNEILGKKLIDGWRRVTGQGIGLSPEVQKEALDSHEALRDKNERLRDAGKRLMQEVYDRSQGYPIPEHHCGFEHHPDEGYCKFHEEWVDIAMALDPAILDEWAEDEVAE